MCVFGCVQLFATPWTVAHQAPLSTGILQARILEWAAMSSSRGSSQPRDQTQVSHTSGRFFTIWATREALLSKFKLVHIYHTLSISIMFKIERCSSILLLFCLKPKTNHEKKISDPWNNSVVTQIKHIWTIKYI